MPRAAFEPAPRDIVDPHAAPYFVQIPVPAHNYDQAWRIGVALAQSAAKLLPDLIDPRRMTVVDKEGLRECLLICGLLLWDERRCPKPYAHRDGCA